MFVVDVVESVVDIVVGNTVVIKYQISYEIMTYRSEIAKLVGARIPNDCEYI